MSEPHAASIAKYLARWAEPEARADFSGVGHYRAVLVVPAFAEPSSLLEGYRAAGRALAGRLLLVLVVNAAVTKADAAKARTRELLRAFDDARPIAAEARSERAGFALALAPRADFDVLLVDRVSIGRELPAKQGVGLARKIGADVALALVSRGNVECPAIFFSDADTSLPQDYFERAARGLGSGASALEFPFTHVVDAEANTPDAARVHDATRLCELGLRYHVLGLAWAGSPYAFHGIGSTLAISASAYAAVRGVPKREAGEDFYLLDKLSKLGPVRRVPGAPLCIRSRRSARVPFGTGPRVEALLAGEPLSLLDPDAYRVLGLVLAALDEFARSRQRGAFEAAFSTLAAPLARGARAALHESGLVDAASDALANVGGGNLRRRVHTWFDALRTLRFLHALRAHGLADVEWRVACERAPFVAAGLATLDAALTRTVALEAELAIELGPALLV